MMFRIGWTPAIVENMTYDDMVHYVGRYVGWAKKQKRR